MKDHSFYILMSYGAFALVLVIELYALRIQRNRAVDEARQMSEAINAGHEAMALESEDRLSRDDTQRGNQGAAP